MTDSHNTTARLLSLAVHEVRTPMTIVAGYLRMLLRERAGPLSDAQRKLVEEAERSSTRLAELTAELSDLANLEAGTATFNRAGLELFRIVDAVAREAQAASDRGVAIEISGDGEAPTNGDAERLRQAFGALIRAVARESVVSKRVTVDRRLKPGDPSTAVIVVGDPAAMAAFGAESEIVPFDMWRGGIGLGLVIGMYVLQEHGARVFAPPGSRTGALVEFPLAGLPEPAG